MLLQNSLAVTSNMNLLPALRLSDLKLRTEEEIPGKVGKERKKMVQGSNVQIQKD